MEDHVVADSPLYKALELALEGGKQNKGHRGKGRHVDNKEELAVKEAAWKGHYATHKPEEGSDRGMAFGAKEDAEAVKPPDGTLSRCTCKCKDGECKCRIVQFPGDFEVYEHHVKTSLDDR